MVRDAEPTSDNIKTLGGIQDMAKFIASSVLRCIVSLDDAVELLFSLSQTTKRTETTTTMAIIESAVHHQAIILFSNHEAGYKEKRNIQLSNICSFNGKQRRTCCDDDNNYKSNLDAKRKKSTKMAELIGEACMDCRRKDHIRGDQKFQSPNFANLKKSDANNHRDEEFVENEGTGKFEGFFRPDTDYSKEKGAW